MSAENLATKAWPHQVEPKPNGLIGVNAPGWKVARVIAGEGVTVAALQVGAGVAQVKREHLVGEADAGVPGVVVAIVDAEREVPEPETDRRARP